MFGYVKTYKPELKISEFEVYRGIYCSLCQTLGKRYGFAARMTLSYDFTFLAILIMALQEDSVKFRSGRCPFNPTKKRMMCHGEENEALNYAADVAMLLVYHKLSDTVADERFLKRSKARLARLFVKHDFKKACKRLPEEAKAATEYMAKQTKVEKEKTSSIDAAAEPTALFLSAIASAHACEENRELLERFGYCLGRYIYLADAADDIEDDKKNRNYNPYLLYAEASSDNRNCDAEQIRMYAAQTLHACVAVCAECYEQLSVKRFDGILRNALYYGMPSVIKSIQEGKKEDNHHEESL